MDTDSMPLFMLTISPYDKLLLWSHRKNGSIVNGVTLPTKDKQTHQDVSRNIGKHNPLFVERTQVTSRMFWAEEDENVTNLMWLLSPVRSILFLESVCTSSTENQHLQTSAFPYDLYFTLTYMYYTGLRFQRSRKILRISKDFHWKMLFCLAPRIVLLARALPLSDACAEMKWKVQNELGDIWNKCFKAKWLVASIMKYSMSVVAASVFKQRLSRSAFALPDGQLPPPLVCLQEIYCFCPPATPATHTSRLKFQVLSRKNEINLYYINILRWTTGG